MGMVVKEVFPMRVLVLGSGLMGPAAAYNALNDANVVQVTLADMSQAQLATAQARLAKFGEDVRLATAPVDLRDEARAAALVGEHDVVISALPSAVTSLGVRAALRAQTPLVDLSWQPHEEIESLRVLTSSAGVLAIIGCGVEPGLTEIMARYVAEKLEQVDELHIKCGGIPETPAPPLGYKIVFGGQRLPLREQEALVVENGKLKPAPRYSGVERVNFAGVGECEAWHEGFMPCLLELDALKHLKVGTQKTVRWPGYAEKATLLRDLGLLSTQPVPIDGAQVTPKHVVDAVLYEHVRLAEGERDITTFRVEAVGRKKGEPRRYTIEMVDRYDTLTGFTSMARVTAFTGAIVARMVGRGEIDAVGVTTPEQVITGKRLQRLVKELAAENVRFYEIVEKRARLEENI
jgi:saccharopine dehydrogenase-like NADP-dependent oxidoreductase